jgi:hypothetical protein
LAQFEGVGWQLSEFCDVTRFIQAVMILFPIVMIIDFSAISAIAFFLLSVKFKLLSNLQ